MTTERDGMRTLLRPGVQSGRGAHRTGYKSAFGNLRSVGTWARPPGCAAPATFGDRQPLSGHPCGSAAVTELSGPHCGHSRFSERRSVVPEAREQAVVAGEFRPWRGLSGTRAKSGSGELRSAHGTAAASEISDAWLDCSIESDVRSSCQYAVGRTSGGRR